MQDPSTASVLALRAAVTHADHSAPLVSRWSVGMHVHHCALSTITIANALAASTPPPPRSGFSFLATLVFLTGRIPRGRGKAPERVLPQPNPSSVELQSLLDECERTLAAITALDRGAWFQHPVFGVVARDRALRFIAIHNRHHLRIVDDINAAGSANRVPTGSCGRVAKS